MSEPNEYPPGPAGEEMAERARQHRETLEWLRENIKPITQDDLLRLASKIEVPEHPLSKADA